MSAEMIRLLKKTINSTLEPIERGRIRKSRNTPFDYVGIASAVGYFTVTWALTILGKDYSVGHDEVGLMWIWQRGHCKVLIYPEEDLPEEDQDRIHYLVILYLDDNSSIGLFSELCYILSMSAIRKEMLS